MLKEFAFFQMRCIYICIFVSVASLWFDSCQQVNSLFQHQRDSGDIYITIWWQLLRGLLLLPQLPVKSTKTGPHSLDEEADTLKFELLN